MAHADPQEAFEYFKDRVIDGLSQQFPVVGKRKTLAVTGFEVDDHLHPDHIKSQHEAKISGQSWAVPLYANMELKDNETGKVIKTDRVRVADLPKMTNRMSYIVDGQEYQVDSQWQLKPGIYTRRKQNGELETVFNVVGNRSFNVLFDPATKKFVMDRNKSKLPLYPLLKATGVSDEELEKTWGKEILAANQKAHGAAGAVERLFKSDRKRPPQSREEAENYLKQILGESRVDPEATALTLGKKFETLNKDALFLSTKKLLQVQGGAPEDDRDALVFKQLRSLGDYASDYISKNRKTVLPKIQRNVDKATTVRQAVTFDMFNKPVRLSFSANQNANVAKQINPVEMLSQAMQTTILGPGGIQSDRAVSDEAKFVNPSHLGFLDPINTPESDRAGVSLRLPMGVKKVGTEARVPLFNLKTGKTEFVPPLEFFKSKVVLPDQVKWDPKTNMPKPVTNKVRMAVEGNDIDDQDFKDAKYVMRHSSQLFNLTSNLIPFMGNTSGNRASMATRHIEQAISLKDRQAPLVQVSTPSTREGFDTFEGLVGRRAAHTAAVDGTVESVKPGEITIKDSAGKLHTVYTYDNYPLNDSKSVLHSTPLVKPGDSIKKGAVVADTNYTQKGQLALGTNLRVGYVPFKGYNFEDGVVISESAAKAMTSTHMIKLELPVHDDVVTDLKSFLTQHSTAFKKNQFEQLNPDGTIKVGTRVMPGDPLVAAMRRFNVKDRTGASAIRKSLLGAHSDNSLKWESEAPGEVVAVHKKVDNKGKKSIVVHVKTEEPMQVGDKLCYDAETDVLTATGWKPVQDVTLDDEIACLVDGKVVYQQPTDVIRYPRGEEMYRIKSQQIDLFVTKEHQMYVKLRGAAEFELHRASTIIGKRVRYKKNGVWEGTQQNTVTLPAMTIDAGQGGVGTRVLEPKVLDTELYMTLLGAFLSNGHVVWQSKSGTYAIGIDKKRGGLEPLLRVLDHFSVKYHRVDSLVTECDRVIIYGKQLAAHFRCLGGARDKYIPNEVFSHARAHLHVLFHWLMWGDGTRRGSGYVAYFLSSKRLADDVQRLALHVGYAANVSVKAEAGAQTTYQVRVITTKFTPQVNHGSAQEEYVVEDYDGPVFCVTVPGHVLYVRRNGLPCWSGNTGRYGNKGIVTSVLPDHEMPHTKDGKPIQVALNPSGVPGRMNIGQVLETAAAKIAEKTGQTYKVVNFDPKTDMLAKIKADLAKHGLSDEEDLIDPVTKQPLGKALVGTQHILKLVHQVDKKVAARSGMTLPGESGKETYDLNLQPVGGAHHGAQSAGVLGMYALLAHGATANIREMQTFKSEGESPSTNPAKGWPSQHGTVWKAIQEGQPVPPPKPTFAFQKFTDMLRATGVNVDKQGHNFVLSPMTDSQILNLAENRVLTKPANIVRTKADKNGELPPLPGGLFDERLTGGHGGKKWSRIPLAEPVANPIFENAIRSLTGLKQAEFAAVVNGEKGVDAKGNLVEVAKGVSTGGLGIEKLLNNIDVNKDLERYEKELQTAPAAQVDKLLKKVKYLRALKQIGAKPSEAYVMRNLPVLPPVMRPISMLPSGDLKVGDINDLYKKFALLNEKLADPITQKTHTEADKKELRRALYDGVSALVGVGVPYKDAEHKGILHQISGIQPKKGFFQKTLMNRRLDLSMRSTIVPEPALSLDEVGLPRDHALDLYRPFVVNQLVKQGVAPTPLQAQKYLAENKSSQVVTHALERVFEDRPVLLKRDPALHKYSIQAFKPRVTTGNTIKIHPLVTGGYNADFDGDTMAAYVPVGRDAVMEAYKMMPSNNLFSEATGELQYTPSLEAALGLYKLSDVRGESKLKFKEPTDALKAVQAGKLKPNELVQIGKMKTTAGRVLLASGVPEQFRDKVLTDLDLRLDKNGMKGLFTDIAKMDHTQFAAHADRLKDIGNGTSFGAVNVPHPDHKGPNKIMAAEKGSEVFIPTGTHSLGLKDFEPDKVTRSKHLAIAQKEVQKIRAIKGLSDGERKRREVMAWEEAGERMALEHQTKLKKNPDNLFTMFQAGVKPGWAQYKQMKLAPLIVEDTFGRPIATPITRSYAEGLDLGGYWTQMHGARKGAVQKVQEVRDPGYMSKLLMANTMDQLVTGEDCGTHQGLALQAADKDVYDRFLQTDFKAGNLHIPAGTLLTPDVVGKIRAAKKDAQILVRSPLKCEHAKGVCQKCMGISARGSTYEVGENVGVHAAHAVGERAIQLTLKAFHTGGVRDRAGSKTLNAFGRFQELTLLPEKVSGAGTVSSQTGVIERIEPDPTGVRVWINGKMHHIGKDPNGNPLHRPLVGVKDWGGLKVGQPVRAGQLLTDPTRTKINPHDLYRATKKIETVQNHLTNEIHDLYRTEGVKKKHVELLVRGMSNLTQVVDPGGDRDTLRGQYRPLTVVKAMNKQLIAQGKKPIVHSPQLKGVAVTPLDLQEDWMAKLMHRGLRQTVLEAAATGAVSDIHGPHPVPGMAYGAEFGMGREMALKPGFKHLENVPKAAY